MNKKLVKKEIDKMFKCSVYKKKEQNCQVYRDDEGEEQERY